VFQYLSQENLETDKMLATIFFPKIILILIKCLVSKNLLPHIIIGLQNKCRHVHVFLCRCHRMQKIQGYRVAVCLHSTMFIPCVNKIGQMVKRLKCEDAQTAWYSQKPMSCVLLRKVTSRRICRRPKLSICIQRWSKIFAVTNLQTTVRWKQLTASA
jgi:hypothetical protein